MARRALDKALLLSRLFGGFLVVCLCPGSSSGGGVERWSPSASRLAELHRHMIRQAQSHDNGSTPLSPTTISVSSGETFVQLLGDYWYVLLVVCVLLVVLCVFICACVVRRRRYSHHSWRTGQPNQAYSQSPESSRSTHQQSSNDNHSNPQQTSSSFVDLSLSPGSLSIGPTPIPSPQPSFASSSQRSLRSGHAPSTGRQRRARRNHSPGHNSCSEDTFRGHQEAHSVRLRRTESLNAAGSRSQHTPRGTNHKLQRRSTSSPMVKVVPLTCGSIRSAPSTASMLSDHSSNHSHSDTSSQQTVVEVDVKVRLGTGGDQEPQSRGEIAAALAESARQLAQSAANFGQENDKLYGVSLSRQPSHLSVSHAPPEKHHRSRALFPNHSSSVLPASVSSSHAHHQSGSAHALHTAGSRVANGNGRLLYYSEEQPSGRSVGGTSISRDGPTSLDRPVYLTSLDRPVTAMSLDRPMSSRDRHRRYSGSSSRQPSSPLTVSYSRSTASPMSDHSASHLPHITRRPLRQSHSGDFRSHSSEFRSHSAASRLSEFYRTARPSNDPISLDNLPPVSGRTTHRVLRQSQSLDSASQYSNGEEEEVDGYWSASPKDHRVYTTLNGMHTPSSIPRNSPIYDFDSRLEEITARLELADFKMEPGVRSSSDSTTSTLRSTSAVRNNKDRLSRLSEKSEHNDQEEVSPLAQEDSCSAVFSETGQSDSLGGSGEQVQQRLSNSANHNPGERSKAKTARLEMPVHMLHDGARHSSQAVSGTTSSTTNPDLRGGRGEGHVISVANGNPLQSASSTCQSLHPDSSFHSHHVRKLTQAQEV